MRRGFTSIVSLTLALVVSSVGSSVASASSRGHSQSLPVAGTAAGRNLPGLAGSLSLTPGTVSITPARSWSFAAYTSDTCSVDTYGPKFWCVADGYYVSHGFIALGNCWEQGMVLWGGCYPSDARAKYLVTLPTGVSCSADENLCMMVGEHYDDPRYPVKIVEVGRNGPAGTIVDEINPVGTTWSMLQHVSCPVSNFCMMVGAAGTSRKTSHGLVYHGHAIAYEWNGRRLIRLSVPAPAASGYSELAGVACITPTTCMAVGNYINARGHWKTYSALWTSGAWQVGPALNVPGENFSTFQAVACPAATTCLATGDAYAKPSSPQTRAFAEEWTAGHWHMSAVPSLQQAGLTGVACPATSLCFAVGWHGTKGLIERWHGTTWAWQNSPHTPQALSGDSLADISCVTASECVAAGYRYNPAIQPATRPFRTLAELWNGHSWTLMQTFV